MRVQFLAGLPKLFKFVKTIGYVSLGLKVYELFKKRFSEDEATTIIEYLEKKADRKFVEKKDVLAKEDISALRSEMKEQKSDILKWVFAFFMTLALMIAGLYLKK